MASDLIVGPKSIEASASLTAKQFYFIKIDTNGQLASVASTGGRSIGVLQDKPTAQGQPGQVCRPGDISKIVLGGTVAAGDFVMSDSNGKGVVCTSGSHILGQALDGGDSGDIVRIVFQDMGEL